MNVEQAKKLPEQQRKQFKATSSYQKVSLPKSVQTRWIPRHKKQVVQAVCCGFLSLRDACQRYKLSTDEFITWWKVYG